VILSFLAFHQLTFKILFLFLLLYTPIIWIDFHKALYIYRFLYLITILLHLANLFFNFIFYFVNSNFIILLLFLAFLTKNELGLIELFLYKGLIPKKINWFLTIILLQPSF